MYDAVSAAAIPADAGMVAGYVDGRYRWSDADWARFPHAVKVRIACFAGTNDGHVLDIEVGCAAPAEFPGWRARRRAAGVEPSAYVNRANWSAVVTAVRAAGGGMPPWWLSTLDGSQPWAPGVVAIQTQGSRLTGRDYDLSLVLDHWPGVDPAAGAFPGAPELLISVKDGPHAGQVFVSNGVSARYIGNPAVLAELQPILGPPHLVSDTVIQFLLAGGGAQAFELTVTPK